MKRGKILSVFIIFVLFLNLFILNLVSAGFTVGNKSHSIDLIYAPSAPIKGWINISLENEPSNSLLSGFGKEIELKDFLDKNFASYTCLPLDCEESYSSVGSSASSKTLSIAYNQEKLIGIKLAGYINNVNNFSFDVSTNVGESCSNSLKIDVLNDGYKEWKAYEISKGSICNTGNPYGCFNQGDSSETSPIVKDSYYCEKINLPAVKGFKIGANIIGTGSANFKILIDAGSYSEECSVSVTNGGEIGCSIEFEEGLDETTEGEVCIVRTSGSEYSIKYEDVNPCGYVGGYEHDFEIFAKPLKYKAVGSFAFTQELIEDNYGIDLSSEIFDYIYTKYGQDCTPECIIPIKFSGANQELTISNLKLKYEVAGIPKTESKIFDIQGSDVLIDSNFQKLYLEKINFSAPSEIGLENFVLKLEGKNIFEEEIEIINIPKINDIIPHEPPSLVPITFIVLMDNKIGNLTYVWNFGDGSDEETTHTNVIKHTYPEIKDYNLSVKVSNQNGETSKTIKVSVVSPKDYINGTILSYRNNIKDFEEELNKNPDWIKGEIKKKIDVDDFKAVINRQEAKYKGAFTDEEYVEIMNSLLGLRIPSKLGISHKAGPGEFFPDENKIDFDVLENLGAGKIGGSREEAVGAINKWISENLDISVESKTYTLYYEDSEEEDLFSYVKITLDPKQDAEETYLVIEGDSSKIKFNKDMDPRETANGAGITFLELTEKKVIEFLYPERLDFLNMPVYVSPEFKEFGVGITPEVCNNNNVCEGGENYKNCRADCKPWLWRGLILMIVLFIGLVVYIILQEWYKRRYESHLFPNKNQLFNLINFMNNSENQGIKKPEIFSELNKMKWKNEQLRYAWNKLHGKRTGMFEIPIFKWKENKEVKEEIQKRQGRVSLSRR